MANPDHPSLDEPAAVLFLLVAGVVYWPVWLLWGLVRRVVSGWSS